MKYCFSKKYIKKIIKTKNFNYKLYNYIIKEYIK